MTINQNQAAIDKIYQRVFGSADEAKKKPPPEPSEPVTNDDQVLIEKAMSSLKNGNLFRQLWEGNWKAAGYSSQSEADLALCSYLAFWTQGDASRIDRLFRQSGLYRDKWERDDYRERTIAKAIEGAAAYDPTYKSGTQQAGEQTEGDDGLQKKADRGDRTRSKADFKAILDQIGQTFAIDSDYERTQAIEQIIESLLDLSPTEQVTLIGKMRDAKLGTKAELERQLRETAKAKQQTESEQAEAAKEKAESEDGSRSVGGVYEAASHYYNYSKRGEEYAPIPISSFIIRPKIRVMLNGKENITADVVTAARTYPDIIIHRNDWNNCERFMNSLPLTDHQWLGSLNDVQNVMAIVSSYDVPTKRGTTQLGHDKSGLWILPDGTALNSNGLVTAPELVYLPVGGQGELDDKISISEIDDRAYTDLLADVYANLFAVNLPTVTIPTIGWFMATPFKPQFSVKYEGFPLLSIAGTRGAGKSTLLRLMWRLMGFKVGDDGKLFSCTETDFVMLKLLSSTTSVPIIFDEYKSYDMPPQRLKALTRLLRKAYDGEKEFRGRPDQTTVEYSLSAPIAVAGEEALTEGALLERIIAVEMSPNHLNPMMRKAYQALRGLPLQAFCSRYIPFALRTDFEKELNRAEVLAADLPDMDTLPDRIQKNLTVMIFGFNQFIRFGVEQNILDENDDLTDSLLEALVAVKNALCGEDGVTKVALDYMIEHLATMAETERLKQGRDYVVRGTYGDIAIRFDSCLAEFRKFHRETQLDGEILNAQAYRKQIKENYERRGYIIGTNASVKYHGTNKKSIIIDPNQAESLNIDLSGFFGNKDNDER